MLLRPGERQQLRVLLVAGDEANHKLTRDVLSEAHGEFKVDWIPDFGRAVGALAANRHHVYLIDSRQDSAACVGLLREATDLGFRGPAIFLGGDNSREIDLRAMESGAADYLVRDELTPALLERSIRYAIRNKRQSEELKALALEDALTGLCNPRAFKNYLLRGLDRARRNNTVGALMFLDLDRFKQVNDTLGHAAGDVMLKEVAQRMRRAVRKVDTVARLGGDEFAVMLENLSDSGGAERVADKLIAQISEPYQIGRRSATVGVSIGITMFPGDSDDADRLIETADTAMYHAKSSGNGVVGSHSLYQSDMMTHTGSWPVDEESAARSPRN